MSPVAALAVLRPGTLAHDAGVTGYNLAARHLAPAVVPSDAAEVEAAVALALRERRRLAVQSTGHGTTGSAEDELLILTNRLSGIEIDALARTARVGAGVRWGALVDRSAEHGLVPLGMASEASVGVAGYTLGGGTGPFARSQGFAADHVLALELVDRDGRRQTLDPDHDGDRFWAIRGGRDGFGIVTSLTLELAEEKPAFSALLSYGADRVDEALAAYVRWQADVPECVGSGGQIVRMPGRPPLLVVQMLFEGPEAVGRAYLGRLTAAARPERVEVASGTPAELLRRRPEPAPMPTWSRSVVLDRLFEDVVPAIVDVAGTRQEVPFLLLELRPLGGAAARLPLVPNAVGHRDAAALVNVVSTPDPQVFDAAAGVGERLWTALAPWTDGRTLLNFDPDARASCWDADTWARLESVRRA
jgi:hypothetical protein